MKIQHIDAFGPNNLRDKLISGTTSKPEDYLVFHWDKVRRFALVKSKGSSYYNRGYNYCPGEIKFYALDYPNPVDRRPSGAVVWDTCSEKGDGRFTYKRSLTLIKEVKKLWEEMVSVDDFKEYAKAYPDTEVKRTKTRIGWCLELHKGLFWINCLKWYEQREWLYEEQTDRGRLYFVTSPEAIEQRKRQEIEQNKVVQDNVIKEWVDKIKGCTSDYELSKVVKEMLKC